MWTHHCQSIHRNYPLVPPCFVSSNSQAKVPLSFWPIPLVTPPVSAWVKLHNMKFTRIVMVVSTCDPCDGAALPPADGRA